MKRSVSNEVAEVVRFLEALSFDQGGVLEEAMPHLRRVIGSDLVSSHGYQEQADSLRVGFFYSAGRGYPPGVPALMDPYLGRSWRASGRWQSRA